MPPLGPGRKFVKKIIIKKLLTFGFAYAIITL